MSQLIAVALMFFSLGSQASAQQGVPDWQAKAGGKMSFEVASIRREEPGRFIPPTFFLDVSNDFNENPHGLFTADFSVATYIGFAYKLWLTPSQMSAVLAGQPKWVASQNFVIQARAPIENPTKDQMRLMLQSLLAERFHLRVHLEKREVPALALTLLKAGKPGPGLQPHSEGLPCGAPAPAGEGKPTFPRSCHSITVAMPPNHTLLMGARDSTMSVIASFLSDQSRLDRPVIDETGLTGTFDLRMEWTPERTSQPLDTPGAPPEAQGAMFLEALHDQLGLQLKPVRANVEILLIDHVEPLTEN